MKKQTFLLVLICFCLSFPASGVKSKTGIFATYTLQNHQGCSYNNAYSFGLSNNYRLVKTIYFQPEIAYRLHNGEGAQREAYLLFTPVQFQFGFHLGLIRPFISGGTFLDFAVTARDKEGNNIQFESLEERASWGYFYGGGIDIINRLQIFYRHQKRWQEEHQIGLSIIF